MFRDRIDAGQRLAAELQSLRREEPVVVALPRGGVPVGEVIATALLAPLDVLIVRKLAAPSNPEFGFGAICEDGAAGVVIIEEQSRHLLGVDQRALDRLIADKREEIARRVDLYRGGRPMMPVTDRTVVLVDDGLATGGTARAAVEALRRRGARRVVLAVPTGSIEAVDALRRVCDDVVCLETPYRFQSVGQQYTDFTQTTDEEVVSALRPPIDVDVRVPIGSGRTLDGQLRIPNKAVAMVLFVHGSGSSRHSPRNRAVAGWLNNAHQATLLIDLLSPLEAADRSAVFDIPLLAQRVRMITRWLHEQQETASLPVAYFGASTGAAAALVASSDVNAIDPLHDDMPGICAIVSRGGRPDLAGEALRRVTAPTLLIVGSRDPEVLDLNERAAPFIAGPTRLEIVPGATHLFEEPGALSVVASLAADWIGENARREGLSLASLGE